MGRAEGARVRELRGDKPQRYPHERESINVTKEAMEAFEQGGQWAMDNVLRKYHEEGDRREALAVRKRQRVTDMAQKVRKAMRGVREVR
jgi:hypothetical protein